MYIVKIGVEPVAVVSENKTIIERKTASIIEPCLLAYGIAVDMTVEDEVKVGKRIEGFPVRIEEDMDEKKIATAVKVCVGFVSGIRPIVEKMEKKLYELKVERKPGEVEGEIEYEEA